MYPLRNVLYLVSACSIRAVAASIVDHDTKTTAPRAILASTSIVGSGVGYEGNVVYSMRPFQVAHGILGCAAFGFFLPLGAILVRIAPGPYRVAAHVWCQIYSLAMALAALGLGVYMAITTEMLLEPHALIGIIAAGGLIFQPLLGALHHRLYKRIRRRTAVSYTHILWGMGLVTLGMINGGLGLQLRGEDQWKILIYGMIVGLIWVGWMLVSILELGRRRRADETLNEEEEKLAMSGALGGVLGSSHGGGITGRSEDSLSTLTPSPPSSPQDRPGTASTGTGARSWFSGRRLSTLMSSLSGRGLTSSGLSSRGLSSRGASSGGIMSPILPPREPTPREGTPREPTPREPTPREPTPREPTPREATPREATPREPTPPEPMPRAPTPPEAVAGEPEATPPGTSSSNPGP